MKGGLGMRGLYKKSVLDLVVAIVALALGVVMLPVFGIVEVFVDILLAAALCAYLVLFLFDKLKHTRGTVFGLTVIEFLLLSIVAIWLVIQQFTALKTASVCRVIGTVLWLRGAVMTAKLYIGALSVKKPRRELPWLGVALAMVSVGVWLFVSPIFSDTVCEWIICIALFITALIFFSLAFLFYHPRKKKQNKNVKCDKPQE